MSDRLSELERAQLEWTMMQIRNERLKIGIQLAGLVVASFAAGSLLTTLVLRLAGVV